MDKLASEGVIPPQRSAPSATPSPRPNVGGGGGDFQLKSGAVPMKNGVLSPHAAEFWFPECRNCPCCKGHRHGCACCTGGVNTCTHPDCLDKEHLKSVEQATKAHTSSSSAGAGAGAESAQGSQASFPRPPAIHTSNSGGTVCKFFLSGTCTYGASCRNLHPGASGTASASPGGSPSGSPRNCLFFQQGKCNKGAQCRFAHVYDSGAMPPPPGA